MPITGAASALPPSAVPAAAPGVAASAFDCSFVVRDVDGAPHTYQLTFHPAGEGQVLMFELMAMLAPPGSALGAMLADGSAGGSAFDVDLATIDWTAAGREIQAVLASKATPELTRPLLAYAVRDNVPVSAVFDRVYRANYGEMLGALWEVIRANRFFSLPGMSLDSAIEAIGPKLRSLLRDETLGTAPSSEG